MPSLSLLLMFHTILNYVERVLQKLIQVNPLLRKGLIRSSFSGSWLVKTWTPPKTEVPQPLWAPVLIFYHPHGNKKVTFSDHLSPPKTYSSSVSVFSGQRGPHSSKISLSPSLLYVEWAHFFQPLLMHHVLQPLDLNWGHPCVSISFSYWRAQSCIQL